MLIFCLVFVCLLLFAILSIKMLWLTLGGAIGMFTMGMLIEIVFKLPGIFIIFTFFISSNLLGKIFRRGKKSSAHEPRTMRQVLANGGMPLFSAVFVILGGSPIFGLGCFLSSIGGATADTWASEAGALKGGAPYHIALRRSVTPGLSGAVTLTGSVFGGLGAILIGVVSFLFLKTIWIGLAAFILIIVLGWGGQWIDTLLGAYLQARYQCKECGRLTDDDGHCGKPATHVHGYTWITNSMVNALSSIVTGLLGGILFTLLLEGVRFGT